MGDHFENGHRTVHLSPLFSWRGALAESDLPATAKHVGLTLSLHMSEIGDSCFPSQARLARETSLNEQTVKRMLSLLRREGWLRAITSAVKGEPVRYVATIPQGVATTPLFSDKGVATIPPSGAQGGSEDTPEVVKSQKHVRTLTSSNANGRTAEQRAALDALFRTAASLGLPAPIPKTARSGYMDILWQLLEAGVTPERLRRGAARYKQEWPDITLTLPALAKWLAQFEHFAPENLGQRAAEAAAAREQRWKEAEA